MSKKVKEYWLKIDFYENRSLTISASTKRGRKKLWKIMKWWLLKHHSPMYYSRGTYTDVFRRKDIAFMRMRTVYKTPPPPQKAKLKNRIRRKVEAFREFMIKLLGF